MKRAPQLMALALLIGDTPPKEFRLFSAGENKTTKGIFLFDEQAANDVMSAYRAHGADIMIDLEHLSIEDPRESRNFDPDARGWCQLELRGGDLWATNVTWTPDGLARLSERRQRYISPCFAFDPDTRRVSQMLNIAITAMPATDNLEPLVAASQRRQLAMNTQGDPAMTPEQFAALAEALDLGPDANVEDVLATVAAMVKKIQDAANGNAPANDGTDTNPADDMPPPAAAANAVPMVAAARVSTGLRVLARLTGKKEIGEVVREIEAWKKSHVELETQRAALAQERATLEGSERRRLVADLVKIGAEVPATAWADDDATKPAEPWASMPIQALRDRVAKLTKGKAPGPGNRQAPAGTQQPSEDGAQVVKVNGHSIELTASEVAACKDTGAKLEDFAANKMFREQRRAQLRKG